MAAARTQLPTSNRVWLPFDPVAGMHICTYADEVVTWDRGKAETNRAKHGVDFADAATVLSDELALTRRDEHPDEDRSVTLGADVFGRLLVVAYVWQGDEPRLISARKATASERRQYERRR